MNDQETVVKRIEREIRDLLGLLSSHRKMGFAVVVVGIFMGASQFSGTLKDYVDMLGWGEEEKPESAAIKQSFSFDLESSTLSLDVSEFCKENCQGNQRAGIIKAVTMEQNPAGELMITIKTVMRSRQFIKPPGGIGGGAAAYDYSANVNLNGKVDLQDCTIAIGQVKTRGDVGKMLQFASSFFSKSYQIENCNELQKQIRS